MQWMSLGLVVVLGGATMLTQSPRFMMIKPTIVHFAVAAGYAWAGLLAALGLANLFVALRLDFATWA